MGIRGIRQARAVENEEPQLIVGVNEIIRNAKEKGYISDRKTNIKSIIKGEGIEIKYRKDLPSSVSGRLEKSNDKWVVSVNENHHHNRQRFTMAHELAHYVLHKDASSSFQDTTFFRDDAYSPIEYAANEFASQLLMPEDDVRQCIKDGVKTLKELSDIFEVSIDAMRNRIKSLGFKTKSAE